MKRPKLKDRKWVKALGSFGKGLIKDPALLIASPVFGALAGAKKMMQEINQDNKNDQTGGHGKPSYFRWISFSLSILIAITYILSAFGLIDSNALEMIINALEMADTKIPIE